VPADYAKIVLTDRIFTRVGSADNLAGGESTFMVEMLETANILNNATERSLIILDEIGRGTSTYDGLAIAWSIIEHIVNNIKARTLFATHYHELISLEDKLPGVKNYFVDVNEENGKVIFMHKILPGYIDKSYGIYVAKISGIPSSVISRADDILDELENNQFKK
jgi:DNA mismatch repair protein MutS